MYNLKINFKGYDLDCKDLVEYKIEAKNGRYYFYISRYIDISEYNSICLDSNFECDMNDIKSFEIY